MNPEHFDAIVLGTGQAGNRWPWTWPGPVAGPPSSNASTSAAHKQ